MLRLLRCLQPAVNRNSSAFAVRSKVKDARALVMFMIVASRWWRKGSPRLQASFLVVPRSVVCSSGQVYVVLCIQVGAVPHLFSGAAEAACFLFRALVCRRKQRELCYRHAQRCPRQNTCVSRCCCRLYVMSLKPGSVTKTQHTECVTQQPVTAVTVPPTKAPVGTVVTPAPIPVTEPPVPITAVRERGTARMGTVCSRRSFRSVFFFRKTSKNGRECFPIPNNLMTWRT